MNVFEKAAELGSQNIPFVMITLLATRGHAPQDPGAKALITESGLAWGTVGGGRIEAKAITHAQELLKNPNTESLQQFTWNLQRDVGMSCGGEVQLLFERMGFNAWSREWKVAVFGAGHVAQALIRQLLQLKCQVFCIDNRPEWLEKLPQNERQLTVIPCKDYSDVISELFKTHHDALFTVVMTRGHATDLPVLEKILKNHKPPYLGVIGSKVKGIKIKKDLREMGVPPEAVEALRCPMGLEINNSNDPAEIGISITAELIQTKARKLALSKNRTDLSI